MVLGDGIRRNIASVSTGERIKLLNAFVTLDSVLYHDGVTKWDKQEQIHKNAHQAGQDVHEGPAFIPWHREIVNRLERLLRIIDPQVSLHYWDWTTDPRHTPNGKGDFVNLFMSEFMGSPKGLAGAPFGNFESTEWIEDPDAPRFIWRNLPKGKPKIPRSVIKDMGLPVNTKFPSDKELVNIADNLPKDQQFHSFDIGIFNVENNHLKWSKVGDHTAHDLVHGYIGGTISKQLFSFLDLESEEQVYKYICTFDPDGRELNIKPHNIRVKKGDRKSINKKRIFQVLAHRRERREIRYYVGHYDTKKYKEKLREFKLGKLKYRPNGRTWCLLNNSVSWKGIGSSRHLSSRQLYEKRLA